MVIVPKRVNRETPPPRGGGGGDRRMVGAPVPAMAATDSARRRRPATRTDGTTGDRRESESTHVRDPEVSRDDLTSEEDFSGTVGFGDEWRTSAPTRGDHYLQHSVRRGRAVRVCARDRRQPAGVPRRGRNADVPRTRLESTRLTGYDVAQLQQFLVLLGFDDGGAMTVDGVFGTTTRNAVRDWQDSRGVDDTGVVTPQESCSALRRCAWRATCGGHDVRGARRDSARGLVTVDASATTAPGSPRAPR